VKRIELAEGQPIQEESQQLIGRAADTCLNQYSMKGMELAEVRPIQEEKQQLIGGAADTCLNQ
jgi:phenylpyruvate tautomerase PptA (4-oxalocrotonate tautomerase family)